MDPMIKSWDDGLNVWYRLASAPIVIPDAGAAVDPGSSTPQHFE